MIPTEYHKHHKEGHSHCSSAFLDTMRLHGANCNRRNAHASVTPLGVALPHLPCEIFRADFRRFFTDCPCLPMSNLVRCANAQPFLCNESGPFQAILGNFQAIFLGPFRRFQAIFRQSQAILGNFGGPNPREKKNSFN